MTGLLRAAALCACIAFSSPAVAQDAPTDRAGLTLYVERLEAVDAVKRLQFAFGYYQDALLPTAMADLFSEKGTFDFEGGKYVGRASLQRLFGGRFAKVGAGKTGPQPGILNEHLIMQSVIDVAPDGRSAKARVRDQVFQGIAGERQETAAGLYEMDFVREGQVWKIAAATYCEGWRNSYFTPLNDTPLPVHPAPAPTRYPGDPLGPDRFSNSACHPWPYAGITPPMHYPHPVTGDQIHKP